MEQWVQAWANARNNVLPPGSPFMEYWYQEYLRWYVGRTRCRVRYAEVEPVPHIASVQDAYPRHRDEQLAGAVSKIQFDLHTYNALVH